MDLGRIEVAAKEIRRCRKALDWLELYGDRLTGRDPNAAFELTLYLAGSCDGAREVTEMIEKYALLSIPELVKSAIANCNNTIAMERSAIREEIDRE